MECASARSADSFTSRVAMGNRRYELGEWQGCDPPTNLLLHCVELSGEEMIGAWNEPKAGMGCSRRDCGGEFFGRRVNVTVAGKKKCG